jgi:hypothetical protein
MLKVLVDFLASNWALFLQEPLTFIVTGIVTGALGFVVGTVLLKNQNDVLRERLNLREDKLKDKDDEIKALIAEVEKVRTEKQSSIKNLRHQNNDYEKYLDQLSILELSNEAQKMAGKLERSAQLSQQRQDPDMRNSHTDVGLYNEWLSEGPKLLAVKHEALKRLPYDARFQVDQVSDSRYTSPAFQADSLMDAVSEIKNIGLKLVEHDANQAQSNLLSQPNNFV